MALVLTKKLAAPPPPLLRHIHHHCISEPPLRRYKANCCVVSLLLPNFPLRQRWGSPSRNQLLSQIKPVLQVVTVRGGLPMVDTPPEQFLFCVEPNRGHGVADEPFINSRVNIQPLDSTPRPYIIRQLSLSHQIVSCTDLSC